MNKEMSFTLENGLTLPAVGFGTYKSTTGDDDRVILAAIEEGYRYFDTASFYKNEVAVGRALKKSGLKREEYAIATKVWKDQMGYEGTKRALEESLEALGVDYVDVYLIHWPRPNLTAQDWKQLDVDTWRAMEEMYEQGKARAIGVSNFLPHHLENILKNGHVKPLVDQIEFHPGYWQRETVEYCKQHGILVQAWSPLGRQRMFAHPLLQELAKKYGVNEAQICIRFALEKGVMPLPKSSHPTRMAQNKEVFHFAMDQEDVKRIENMEMAGWSGEHPDKERVSV